MQSQNRDEKGKKYLSSKGVKYYSTIKRREIFRKLRFSMWNMGLDFPVSFTVHIDAYCIKYGNENVEYAL